MIGEQFSGFDVAGVRMETGRKTPGEDRVDDENTIQL